MDEFEKLGKTLRNKNSIQEEINPLNAELNPICHLLSLLGVHHILHVSRVRAKNCLHSRYSVEIFLPSTLLSENIKIKLYRNQNFSRCFYECETWPLILKQVLRPKVLENRLLMRTFGPKRDEVR